MTSADTPRKGLLDSLLLLVVLILGVAIFGLMGTRTGDLQVIAIVSFTWVSALALYRYRSQPKLGMDARILVAIVLAYSGTWLGLGNQERWDGPAAGWDFSSSEYELWLEENGASRNDYETTIVAGFPPQGIEGTDTAAASERLLPGKGLGAMIANFLLQTAAFMALALALPRRLLWPIGWAAVALTPLMGLLGRIGLIVGLLD